MQYIMSPGFPSRFKELRLTAMTIFCGILAVGSDFLVKNSMKKTTFVCTLTC
jgi:hypothetical protein